MRELTASEFSGRISVAQTMIARREVCRPRGGLDSGFSERCSAEIRMEHYSGSIDDRA